MSSILSTIQKLRVLSTRREKLQWAIITGLALCSALLEIVTACLIMVFATTLTQADQGFIYFKKLGLTSNISSGHLIFYIALGVGVIYVIKNLMVSVEIFYQNFSIQHALYHFKGRLLHLYGRMDYQFYLSRNSSIGLQTISHDVDHIYSSGLIALAIILTEGVILISLFAVLIYVYPSIALALFGLTAALGGITVKFILPYFYRLGQKYQEAALQAHRHLVQFFHAFKEIMISDKQDFFIESYNTYSQKRSHAQALQLAFNALPRVIIETIFVGLFVIATAWLCLKHESPSHITGILSAYFYAGFRIMPSLNRIINQLNTFKAIIPSIEAIYKEYTSMAMRPAHANLASFHFVEKIAMHDVSFKYLHNPKEALSHISLEIHKGESIGIIGKTGSGKSTLIDLILGLLSPYQGHILIDDRYPVNCLQWHKKIGYVPQNIYLIDDTIAANIAFGEKEFNSERLDRAIQSAQLSDFIKDLPLGIYTVIGERGIRLSGGERQRIAIARALYHEPDILIFDEATSALDNHTEATLMETIDAVSKNRTVIMIAHRLTTLEKCDRIIVMDKGKIKQITSYKDLAKP